MYLKPLNPDWHEQKMVPMGECTLVGIADTKIEALR
jgi:SOS-response transcriptional repressor LexA